MIERDFAYWLQGYFESLDTLGLTPAQRQLVQDKLNQTLDIANYSPTPLSLKKLTTTPPYTITC
jgi:hypothetical protein